MNSYINNILKLKEQNKRLNNDICILKKQKDDTKLKIDTFDSLDDNIDKNDKERDSLKTALNLLYLNLVELIVVSVAFLPCFVCLAFVAFNSGLFVITLLICFVFVITLIASIHCISLTFKRIKNCKLDIKNKIKELDNVFDEIYSYGKTKEELTIIFLSLESKIFSTQKMIDCNNIKINELKQGIINQYVKNNMNIKTLKEATKVKKLTK